MAGNFGVRFFTRGYEKTKREQDDIHRGATNIRSAFQRVGPEGERSGSMVARGLGLMRVGLTATVGALRVFIHLTSMAIKVLAGLGAAVTAVGVGLATKFSYGLMKTREGFYLIETALTGVVKNAAVVRKISEWAMQYAAVYPAMYEDIMEAMKGMAMMPALKPMFTKAQTEDMEKIMNIVQGLAALDPQQGVRGALYAMREALAGQWRTLMYRFEIRPEAVAAAAGLSYDEIKKSPQAAIEALDAFIKLNVGADTLRKTAQSLGVQFGNITDKYKMWLNTVGDMGAYQRMVKFLIWINELWDKILGGPRATEFGKTISRVFEGAIGGLESILTEDIDWEGKGLFQNLLQAGRNAMKKLKDIFVDAKEMLLIGMQLALAYMAHGVVLFVQKVFIPVGKEIATMIVQGFSEALKAKGRQIKQDIKDAFRPEALQEQGRGFLRSYWEDAMFGPALRYFGGGAGGGAVQWIKKFFGGEDKGPAYVGRTVEMPKETGYFGELIGRLSENMKDVVKLFTTKMEARLPEAAGYGGERKLTAAEEARNAVLERQYQLRLALVTGTQKQVEAMRSELDHAQRMLRYYEAVEAWEKDPTGGKRLAAVKEQIERLNAARMDAVRIGKVDEDLEKRLLQLHKERADLQEKMAQALPKTGRYEGADFSISSMLERLVKEGVAKQEKSKNLYEQIKTLEIEIADLKKGEVNDLEAIIEKQVELNELQKQSAALLHTIQARYNQLDMPDTMFAEWSLGKEMEGLREKYKGSEEALKVIDEIEKMEKGQIEKARREKLLGIQAAKKEETEEAKKNLETLKAAYLEQYGSMKDGVLSALEEIKDKHKSTFQSIKEIVLTTAESAEETLSTLFFDALNDKLDNLWDYVGRFARMVEMELSRLMARQFVSGVGDLFTSWFGGGSPGGGTPGTMFPGGGYMPPNQNFIYNMHNGGDAGAAYLRRRAMPPWLEFANARGPRLGLNVDEYLTVLRRTERVSEKPSITEQLLEAIKDSQGQGRPLSVPVNVVINGVGAADAQRLTLRLERNIEDVVIRTVRGLI